MLANMLGFDCHGDRILANINQNRRTDYASMMPVCIVMVSN